MSKRLADPRNGMEKKMGNKGENSLFCKAKGGKRERWNPFSLAADVVK